ncbi:MAG: lipoyl(octanoyl) transferase LipB [Myxococcaceae bacterium]|nr:lipoyl(octanoyl) transferase LipB [Myxococcaceae bacterium]
MSRRPLRIHHLGQVEYEDGLNLMRLFGEARRAGQVPDTLLVLEHPPVLTLGRAAKPENVTTPPEVLARMGIQLHETNRGGDVTYHGPGQVVAYPIFLLPPERQDVRRFVRDVEESVKRTLAAYGLTGHTVPKWPGVWVGDVERGNVRKVAAIGVHLARWLTSHGVALNVNTNLAHFGLIVPCGIREAGVTSMQRELGRGLDFREVAERLAASFCDVFEGEPEAGVLSLRTVSVAVMREGREGPEALVLRRTPVRGGFWQTVTGRLEGPEAPSEAAAREVLEEVGLAGPVVDLGYRHAFALGEEVPPRLVEEHAFAVRAPAGFTPRLSAVEHDAAEWLPVPAALERLPFAGLRRAVRLAAESLFAERPGTERAQSPTA